MRPLLSLGIPTYNRAPYLDRLLSSLVEDAKHLTENELEILIKDNASTDNTREVCERYGKLIPGLKYHRNPENVGVLKNGAEVHEMLTGEWNWLSGDDDFFSPGVLPKLFEEIRKDKCDIILLNRSQCDRDESVVITESVVEGIGDRYFDRLGDFASVPCSFELVGFLGSALYKRDCQDVHNQGVFHLPNYFHHVCVIFDAFGNRPVKFFSEPMLTQRLFNIRAGGPLETTIAVSLTSGLSFLRELLLVQERGNMSPDEVWGWSSRRAYGKGGGAISLIEWTFNYLIKGPLLNDFGQIPEDDYQMLYDFVTGEGRALPKEYFEKTYRIFAAAVDGLKARRALISA